MERLTMTNAEMDEVRQYAPNFDCPIKAEEGSVTQRFCGVVCDEFQNNCPFEKMGHKLKSYEDAEEQGLLLRLPCKEETPVWTFDRLIFRDKKSCKDCIYFGDDGLGGCCDYEEDYPDCTKVYETKFKLDMFDNFGKTVFLTKEEAEQALEEMKGV